MDIRCERGKGQGSSEDARDHQNPQHAPSGGRYGGDKGQAHSRYKPRQVDGCGGKAGAQKVPPPSGVSEGKRGRYSSRREEDQKDFLEGHQEGAGYPEYEDGRQDNGCGGHRRRAPDSPRFRGNTPRYRTPESVSRGGGLRESPEAFENLHRPCCGGLHGCPEDHKGSPRSSRAQGYRRRGRSAGLEPAQRLPSEGSGGGQID